MKLKTLRELVEEYAKDKATQILTDIGSLPSEPYRSKAYWKSNAKVVELIISFYNLED